MGQGDWLELEGKLETTSIKRGVRYGTGGFTPPNGGAAFVFGYNSRAVATGAHGMYVALDGFIPTSGGGIVRGAVKRVASGGNTGFSPFLFFCCQGATAPSVNDTAYLLGLSDADPYEIVLAKGPILAGLVESATEVKFLARSTSQYSIGDGLWHHLQLEVICQPNGDVKLVAKANDLAVHEVTAPVWEAIPGLSDVVDDCLDVETGSDPLIGGYAGWAFALAGQVNRRAAFDAIQALRVPE